MELRLEIYNYLCTTPFWKDNLRYPDFNNLSCVNHQLYGETMAMWYNNTVVYFSFNHYHDEFTTTGEELFFISTTPHIQALNKRWC